MKSNKLIVLFSVVLTFMFYACKKNDSAPALVTGNFVFEKESDYSSIRLFTKNGEINDSSLVAIYKTKFSNLIFPLQNQILSGDTINVINTSDAKYGNKMYRINRVDNFYQLRSVDSINYWGNIDSVFYELRKYKAYYAIQYAPVYGMYIGKTFSYYYLTFSDNKLVLPFINAIRFSTWYYQGVAVRNYYQGQTMNNVADLNAINRLPATDTLLLQTFNRYCRKID